MALLLLRTAYYIMNRHFRSAWCVYIPTALCLHVRQLRIVMTVYGTHYRLKYSSTEVSQKRIRKWVNIDSFCCSHGSVTDFGTESRLACMGNPAVKFLRTRPRASPAPQSINPGEDSFSSRFLTLPIPEAMGADWGLTVNKQPT